MSPPVVLLHGLATSANRTWVETGWVDLLRDEGREVSAPDLPGHGRGEELTADDARRLEDLVAATLPAGPLDAVGFSLGARVLLVLASREPQRFGKLVLAGVGANLFRDDDHRVLADHLDGSASDDAPISHHFAQLCGDSATPPGTVSTLLRTPRPPLTDDALGRIEARCLVVVGDRDFAGPGDPLVDRLSDASLVTLPGVDHFATPKSMAFLDAGLRFLG